jgi:hypothetical protein
MTAQPVHTSHTPPEMRCRDNARVSAHAPGGLGIRRDNRRAVADPALVMTLDPADCAHLEREIVDPAAPPGDASNWKLVPAQTLAERGVAVVPRRYHRSQAVGVRRLVVGGRPVLVGLGADSAHDRAAVIAARLAEAGIETGMTSVTDPRGPRAPDAAAAHLAARMRAQGKRLRDRLELRGPESAADRVASAFLRERGFGPDGRELKPRKETR